MGGAVIVTGESVSPSAGLIRQAPRLGVEKHIPGRLGAQGGGSQESKV